MQTRRTLVVLVMMLTLFSPIASLTGAQEPEPAVDPPVVTDDTSTKQTPETENQGETPAETEPEVSDLPVDANSSADETETVMETTTPADPPASTDAPSESVETTGAAQAMAPPDLGIDDAIVFTGLTCDGALTISYTNVPGTTALNLILLADGVVVGSMTPVISGGTDVISRQFDLSGAGTYDSLTVRLREGSVDKPVIVTSRTVSGCQAGGDDEPPLGETDAYFRNLTCDGTVQFTWAGYQSDGHFTMHVTADGGDIEYVLMSLTASSGSTTLTLPSYASIAEPGGAGEYYVTARYVTNGGLVGPTAASATLHTCGDGEPEPASPTATISGLTCTSDRLTLNWQNISGPQTVLRSVSIDGHTIWSESVSIDQASGSLSYMIPPYEEYARSDDSGTVVAQAAWSSSTAPNWLTARSTVSDCNHQPPVLGDVRITVLRCDQTGSFTWSNVTSTEEFILDWQWSDGGPRGQMTIPVTATTGSWDFVLQSGIGTSAWPAADAAQPVANPVLSLNVYLDQVDWDHLVASYSALFCAGWEPVDSGFHLGDISCDGTAVLSWSGLEEEMGFSVYPSVFPSQDDVELAGETGVAGPGSGSHDIAIDLTGFDGVFDFSLTVTAGGSDEGQEIVAEDLVLDCGLPWVDPTDPTNPTGPVPSDPTPVVAGGTVNVVSTGTSQVAALPVTGAPQPDTRFPVDAMVLAVAAAGTAVAGGWQWRRATDR